MESDCDAIGPASGRHTNRAFAVLRTNVRSLGYRGFCGLSPDGATLDGIKVGATVAFVTFVVFDLAVILRVNLFLDTLRQRSDWQNLIMRFQASGFESLRPYANYHYVIGAPFKILAASIIGAGTGVVGGFLGSLGHREMDECHRS